MKTFRQSFYYFSLLLLTLFACTQKEKVGENEPIIIDVTREFPEKTMLLQDIAEVEYVRLETPEDMLWQGWSVSAFTDRYILNHNLRTGDILFFDRAGKGIRKINRQGAGGEEYSSFSSLLFDESQEELYFNDGDKKKIFVYNMEGDLKRILDYAPNKRYTGLAVFDADRLIAYNELHSEDKVNTYLILSKKTGEIENEFIIPQTARKLFTRLHVNDGEYEMVYMFQSYPLMESSSGLILSEVSNDTIFSMNRAMELKPMIIQKPSRPTMDPETFLFQAMESQEYLFLYTITKRLIGEGMNAKIESHNLVYDKKEGQLYKQNILNGDFTSEKKQTISPQTSQLSVSDKNVYLAVLEAGDLIEAYENNQLKGRLKEIAKDLEEEDNPVLLIARFK